MGQIYLVGELIGHTICILTFGLMAVYFTIRRSKLRRTVKRPNFIYWLLIAFAVFFSLANALHMYLLTLPSSPEQLVVSIGFLAEYPSLVAQSVLILMVINLKISSNSKEAPRRALAIGAHPDDIEIACGGTLAKMIDAGYEVAGLVLTRGEQGGNGQRRPLEARNGANFLGLKQINVFSFEDTCLEEQSHEILAAIEDAILQFQPDIILTHSPHDHHQDHVAVYEATLRASRNHSTLLCYESPSTTRDFVPSLFVDISQYIDMKVESIRIHSDQRAKPYLHPERVLGVALFRGGQAKTHAAEGFEIVRALYSALGEI